LHKAKPITYRASAEAEAAAAGGGGGEGRGKEYNTGKREAEAAGR
jgi:hypothetical protein